MPYIVEVDMQTINVADNTAPKYFVIGGFVKSFRDQQGVSLTYVETLMGMPKGSLGKVEKGTRYFTRQELEDFCALFLITASELGAVAAEG